MGVAFGTGSRTGSRPLYVPERQTRLNTSTLVGPNSLVEYESMRETNRPQITPGSDWHHRLRTGSGLAYSQRGNLDQKNSLSTRGPQGIY
jgi:hypothetical protein